MQTRRDFLLSFSITIAAGLTASTQAHAGSSPIELSWRDLVPDGGGETMERLRELGVVQHGDLSTPFDQETEAELTTEYNGKLVRIPGYLVPLEFSGQNVKLALLVPYVGACIHVPPPPPNQLILITAEAPYAAKSLFEPVWIEGIFETAAASTLLAEVGYTILAQEIAPYS